MSLGPGSSVQARLGWRQPPRGGVGSGPKRSPRLSSSRRGSGGGRGKAGRGHSSARSASQHRRGHVPLAAVACRRLSHCDMQSKPRGRWLLVTCGHGKGLFYFNRCPGRQGGFLLRILSQRPAGAAPPSRAASPARKATMVEGPAPSSGLRHTAEGTEGQAGERRGNAAEGAARMGSSEGHGKVQAPGTGGTASADEELRELSGLSRLFPPYSCCLREESPVPPATPECSQAQPQHWDETPPQGWEGKFKVQ